MTPPREEVLHAGGNPRDVIPTVPLKIAPGDVAEVSGARQIETLIGLGREFGPLFRMRIIFHRYLLASGFEAVKELCDHRRFRKVVRGELAVLRDIAGDGLFTAHGDEPAWRVRTTCWPRRWPPRRCARRFPGWRKSPSAWSRAGIMRTKLTSPKR